MNLGLPTTRTRILNPPTDPDVCCTNSTSITIPIAPRHAGNSNIAKYFQDLRYKSPEWQAVYGTLRNTIEGFNGFTKSRTEENTEEPARRRVRGYAFQTLAVAILQLSMAKNHGSLAGSLDANLNAWMQESHTSCTPWTFTGERYQMDPLAVRVRYIQVNSYLQ
ncbi:MAG: hypothetical protein V9E98_00005 [Candidatus Nanopelagicales bacterium]